MAEMIEEATVDAYNDSKLVTGWYTMLEQNLAVPFETSLLRVTVTVQRIEAYRRWLKGQGL